MAEENGQLKLTNEYIENLLNESDLNLLNKKEDILNSIKDLLISRGFTEKQINRNLTIGRIIDKKQFYHALSIVKNILNNTGTNIDCDNYDGLIVRKLSDADVVTMNKTNKKCGQTDIRPIKDQEDIFPYLKSSEVYMNDNKAYNSLKNYFLFKINVNLYESNLDYLKNKQKSFKDDNLLKTNTTILNDNRNRLEISSQTSLDGEYFTEFRKLLYEHDYLIVLKRKESFEYDFFGIKIKDDETGEPLYDENGMLLVDEEGLADLNGSFYYIDTMTLISEDMFDDEACTTTLDFGENRLLYGVPGSGKSWKIKNEICKGVEDFCIERVVFHPDYTYSDFVGQILPKVSENDVDYKFEPGPFTNILKKAHDNPFDKFYLIIEEINRGNAPAIFGDVFQLLDRIKKDDVDKGLKKGDSEFGITNFEIAKEVYGKGEEHRKVRIPYNLSIIATMNTSDQNVFTLDTAFKRRWHMEMIKNDFTEPIFKDKCVPNSGITWQVFGEAVNEVILDMANSTLSSEDKRLGAFFVDEEDLDSTKQFAEKVLMYLWDDVFKFSRDDYFNRDSVDQFSLESFIYEFEKNQETDTFRIFKPIINNKIKEVKGKIKKEEDESQDEVVYEFEKEENDSE